MLRKFSHGLQSFQRQEDGAVTVDFVAITAGVIALGAVVIYSISDSVINWSYFIGDTVTTVAGF